MRNHNKIFVLSCLLLSFSKLSAAHKEYLQVIEVVRHGWRSPQEILPFNTTSIQFNDTSSLMEFGFLQHFHLGEYIREKYILNQTNFLPKDYDPSQVFVMSSNKDRANQSGWAQLAGMYPDQAPPLRWLPIPPGTNNPGFQTTMLPESINRVTKLTEKNCQKYSLANADCKNKTDQVRQYFSNTYKEDIEALTGAWNVTQNQFDNICEYLFFSQPTQISLNFTPTAFARNYCAAYEDGYMYQMNYCSDQQWKTLSFEFMTQIKEFTDYVSGKISGLTQMPTFWKYYQLNNQGATTVPKFVNYISHDEIMGAFFEALGWHQMKGAYPAASIFFEFYRENGQIFVQLKYKWTLEKTYKIIPNGYNDNVFTIEEFAKFMDGVLKNIGITNIDEECAKPLDQNIVYYAPERAIKGYIHEYELLPYKGAQTSLSKKLAQSIL